MAVSVCMDPVLEKQLEQAARRQGVTKSQVIVSAVQRALGGKNPYEIMLALKAEEARPACDAQAKAFADDEQLYDTDYSRALMVEKLKAKHGGSAG